MTDALASLPPLRDVITDAGLRADKRLGQHFLLDLNLTGRIARAAGDLTDGTVIEVGPGPGGLTRALLARGATHLVAIEKDPRCLAALSPLADAAQGALRVIEADATKVGFADLGPPPYTIVANLPYNVGTPLLIGWLTGDTPIASMTLMFQKEVAERITAAPGDAAYGRLSVIANWRCETDYAFTVPARAFTPPPKIDSAVVTLRPYETPPYDGDIRVLEKVTAAAFGQRRKMLRQSLKSLGLDVAALLEQAGLDGTARAEEIDIAGYGHLAAAVTRADHD
ncbi:MAG: 16S rRNA (adenine(1518)-N(6)/adenine(1519)-N(6))-dimethyltransferase RsmA [Alphaproteobacteria bacterium]